MSAGYDEAPLTVRNWSIAVIPPNPLEWQQTTDYGR